MKTFLLGLIKVIPAKFWLSVLETLLHKLADQTKTDKDDKLVEILFEALHQRSVVKPETAKVVNQLIDRKQAMRGK